MNSRCLPPPRKNDAAHMGLPISHSPFHLLLVCAKRSTLDKCAHRPDSLNTSTHYRSLTASLLATPLGSWTSRATMLPSPAAWRAHANMKPSENAGRVPSAEWATIAPPSVFSTVSLHSCSEESLELIWKSQKTRIEACRTKGRSRRLFGIVVGETLRPPRVR